MAAKEDGDGGGGGGGGWVKMVCEYGMACYRKNPQHFLEFSHPWLGMWLLPACRDSAIEAENNLLLFTNTASDEEEDEDVPAAKRQKHDEASSSTRLPHLTSLPSSSSATSSASSSPSPPPLFYFTKVRGIDGRFNTPDLSITIRGQCTYTYSKYCTLQYNMSI